MVHHSKHHSEEDLVEKENDMTEASRSNQRRRAPR